MNNSDIVRVLRMRDYRLFAIGQAVSNTGTWMQRIAQDWLVLQLTGNSGLALGVITALQCAPVLLFGMWGGLVADRFPKRTVLILAQFALFVPAAALGLLTAAGLVQVWHVCVLAFGLGLATAFDQPARQAIIVELTGRETLSAAVSVNSLIYNGARLVGPSAAGVVIAGFGVSSGILLNVLSYLIVVVLVKAMRPGTAGEQPVARSENRLRAGLAYVGVRPHLLLPIVVIGLTSGFGQSMQVLLPLLAKCSFGTDADGYGLLVAAMAIGAIVGTVCFTSRVRSPRASVLVGAALAFGALEIVAALSPSYWLWFATLVATGVALLITNVSANSAVQLQVDPAFRGRTMALFVVVLLTSNSLGALLMGSLAQALSAPAALVIGGGAVLTTVPIAALLLSDRSRLAW